MTDINTESDDLPAEEPELHKTLAAIAEIEQRLKMTAGNAARAEGEAEGYVYPPRSVRQPGQSWNDLWRVERPVPAPLPDTETLLNGLIDECGFLMREVAFRLMRTAGDDHDMERNMGRAMSLAQTGANVGLAIAKLRRSSAIESRQSITLERVERLPEIENRSIRANNDQDVAP